MKLEEINNKTNEAFSYLVAALESGESDVLTQYLNARKSAAPKRARDGALVMVGRGWAADGSNGEREIIRTRVRV